MVYKFIVYDNDFNEMVVAKAALKTDNGIYNRLVREANKFFGNEQWEQVPDCDQSLDNVLGWYARKIGGGGETLEVKPVWE